MASSSPTVLATSHSFNRRLRNDLSSRFHSRVDEKSRTPLLILRCWRFYYSSGHVSGFLFSLFFRCLQGDHWPQKCPSSQGLQDTCGSIHSSITLKSHAVPGRIQPMDGFSSSSSSQSMAFAHVLLQKPLKLFVIKPIYRIKVDKNETVLNPRRYPRIPRVYTYKDKKDLLKRIKVKEDLLTANKKSPFTYYYPINEGYAQSPSLLAQRPGFVTRDVLSCELTHCQYYS